MRRRVLPQNGGVKLGSQLYHSGRKGSVSTAWEGQ
jgi:hypothetical protein